MSEQISSFQQVLVIRLLAILCTKDALSRVKDERKTNGLRILLEPHFTHSTKTKVPERIETLVEGSLVLSNIQVKLKFCT